MNELVLRLLGYPPIGKFVLKMAKKRILKPFKLSLAATMEKQQKMLQEKFRRMENTEIGRRLGIKEGASLQDLPITDYSFYEPFFSNPSPQAFMYPLESYERMKTSGTAGREKWFMMPKNYILKSVFETAVPAVLLSTFDGTRITLDYGDTLYVNTAPRPYAVGAMASVASGKKGRFPLFNLVPNFALPFEEKVQYFIANTEKINFALVQASILVSRIIPEAKKPGNLKGIFSPDTAIADVYYDEISRFAGIPPRTSYNSTETLMCSIPSVEHPLGFFIDWRQGVSEFVPVDHELGGKGRALTIDKVEVGKVYQFIHTGLHSEITRYNTMNAFKCIAKGDADLGIDCPIFKFHTRLDKVISLHNFTRISEDELIGALKEGNVPFVEFTSRIEVEKGLEYLALYVETTPDKAAKEIQESVHKQLYDVDGDYRDLADFYGYVPIRVFIVPQGVFAKYLMDKQGSLPKVDRILMRDEEFRKVAWYIKHLA